MDANLLVTKVGELQALHGKNIKVHINHEPIADVVFMPACADPRDKEDVTSAYLNIKGV